MQEFLRWWWEQITEVLHLTFASLVRKTTIVELSFEQISVVKREGLELKSKGTEPNDGPGQQKIVNLLDADTEKTGTLFIRLPESEILRCFLTVPMTASGRLDEFLGYEIDRATPFSRDEVFWTYSVKQRDSSKKVIYLELIVIPASSYAYFRNMMSNLGINPKGIEVSAYDAPSMIIPLEGQTNPQPLMRRKWSVAIAGAVTVLLLLVATPFIVQSRAISAANDTIGLYDFEAKQAGSFRHTIRILAKTTQFLDEQRMQSADPIIVMADVSKLLPLDSYLTAFSLRENHLTISGLSPSAAQLIGLFAQSGEFREPAFVSPITQDESSRLESFAVAMQIPGRNP